MVGLDALAGRVSSLSVPGGTAVVTQGEEGDRFYVVRSGSAEVLVDGFVVGVFGPGDSFGEKALLRDVPRTATVRSCEPMEMLTLARGEFLAAVTGQERVPARHETSALSGTIEWSRRQRIELLSRVSLLSHLDSHALGALAERSVVDR